MLKRNLIIIAIISLSVFLTSNAFGQNNKRKQTKAKVAAHTTSITSTNARTANPNVQPAIMKDGNNNITLENYRTGKRKVSRNMDDISNGSYRIRKAKPKPTSTGDQPELQITTSTPPTNARTANPKMLNNKDVYGLGGPYQIIAPTDSASGLPTGKKSPQPVATNLMKGHEGMQERNAASGNTTNKKRQVKPVWDDTDIVHRQARKRGVTHDSEFENWANRKRKITKTRRKNK